MCRQQAMRVIGLLSRFSVVLAVTLSAAATTPPPSHAVVISGITPQVGRPQGGQIVRINGSNFSSPVRVFFGAIEAMVVSASNTSVDVLTPGVLLLPAGAQQMVTDVTVVIGEDRVTAKDAFTFRKETLTPVIHTVTPSRGSVAGGTRVTIFGEGFEAPVQVLFAGATTAEARVINVEFDRIIAEVPPAALLGAREGDAVDVRIRNINSQTEAVLRGAFRFQPRLSITGISPTIGPASGGTNLRISGAGFNAPILVTVAGVPAQVLLITGTEIVARTTAAEVHDCQDRSGAVQVVNLDNGDLAEGPAFTYIPQPAIITGISPQMASPGTTIEVTLANVANGDLVTLTLGTLVSFPTVVVDSKVRVMIPPRMNFPGSLCRPQAVTLDLKIADRSGCTNALPAAILVLPPKPACAVIPRR